MPNTEEPKTCNEMIYDGGWSGYHVCGRKVADKDPDGQLCGLHYSVKVRNADKRAKYNEARQHRADQKARVAKLGAELGVSLALHTMYQGATTGTVATGQALINITALESLLQRISELESK